LSRFEREAKLLASPNHPNVATLYGLEEREGQKFHVMDLPRMMVGRSAQAASRLHQASADFGQVGDDGLGGRVSIVAVSS